MKIQLEIPDAAARYFREKHGDAAKFCQDLLNNSLRSILQQEASEVLDKSGYARACVVIGHTVVEYPIFIEE